MIEGRLAPNSVGRLRRPLTENPALEDRAGSIPLAGIGTPLEIRFGLVAGVDGVAPVLDPLIDLGHGHGTGHRDRQPGQAGSNVRMVETTEREEVPLRIAIGTGELLFAVTLARRRGGVADAQPGVMPGRVEHGICRAVVRRFDPFIFVEDEEHSRPVPTLKALALSSGVPLGPVILTARHVRGRIAREVVAETGRIPLQPHFRPHEIAHVPQRGSRGDDDARIAGVVPPVDQHGPDERFSDRVACPGLDSVGRRQQPAGNLLLIGRERDLQDVRGVSHRIIFVLRHRGRAAR